MTKDEFISALILLGWIDLSHISHNYYFQYNNFDLAVAFDNDFQNIDFRSKILAKTLYPGPTLLPIILSYMKDE